MSSHLLFLGTYTRNGSKGIYSLHLDAATGALTTPTLAAESPDPTWLTLSPDREFLYAVAASATQARGFKVELTSGRLTALPPRPGADLNQPSHLAVDATGRVLLAANYRDGFVASIPIQSDGSLGSPNVIKHEGRSVDASRQDKPHPHSVTLSPDNRFVIVADLGLDKIFTYALDPATATLSPATPRFVACTPGTGPRHFTFSRDGRHGYVINEMGGSITAYDYDTAHGTLTPRQTVSTLPSDFTGLKWNAEIRAHPNGTFLYASNRTHDSLAVFAREPATGLLSDAPVQIIPSGGKNPRNFAVSPDGKWLVCGHQDTDLVTVFAIDPTTGQLTRTPHRATVPAVVCVLFVD